MLKKESVMTTYENLRDEAHTMVERGDYSIRTGRTRLAGMFYEKAKELYEQAALVVFEREGRTRSRSRPPYRHLPPGALG